MCENASYGVNAFHNYVHFMYLLGHEGPYIEICPLAVDLIILGILTPVLTILLSTALLYFAL